MLIAVSSKWCDCAILTLRYVYYKWRYIFGEFTTNSSVEEEDWSSLKVLGKYSKVGVVEFVADIT